MIVASGTAIKEITVYSNPGYIPGLIAVAGTIIGVLIGFFMNILKDLFVNKKEEERSIEKMILEVVDNIDIFHMIKAEMTSGMTAGDIPSKPFVTHRRFKRMVYEKLRLSSIFTGVMTRNLAVYGQLEKTYTKLIDINVALDTQDTQSKKPYPEYPYDNLTIAEFLEKAGDDLIEAQGNLADLL